MLSGQRAAYLKSSSNKSKIDQPKEKGGWLVGGGGENDKPTELRSESDIKSQEKAKVRVSLLSQGMNFHDL